MTAGWRRWLRIFARDPQRDVDAELRFHMEARIDDLVARGAAPGAARAQALEEFGDLDTTRERLGAIDERIAQRNRRADWWEGIAQDLRHTLRGLVRSPGFTVMVVVTLALGIGANAAVFSVLDRLFFAAPAGVAHREQVRRIVGQVQYANAPGLHERSVFAYPEVRAMREAVAPDIPLGAYVVEQDRIGAAADGPLSAITYTADDYFGVLGIHASIGRLFSAEEESAAGLTPVAVISDRLWRQRFGGSTDVLGKSIKIWPHTYTIIGVAPKGFDGLSLDASDVWVPFNTLGWWSAREPKWYETRHTLSLQPIARARTAAALARLATGVTTAVRSVALLRGATETISLRTLDGAGGRNFIARQSAISLRLGAVALIILIVAIANVANLMLARASSRRRETAVRLALGVTRRRLVWHVMSESVVAAILAGAAAVVVAAWAGALLRRSLLPMVVWGQSRFSVDVALFAGAAAVVAGIGSALLPAIQGSRPEIAGALKGDGRAGRSARSRTRTALLIVQSALSIVLLAGAGLFVNSLRRVESIDLGFDAPNLVFVSPSAIDDTAMAHQISGRLPALAEQLARIPGVDRVALANNPPMWGISFFDVYLPGRDSLPGGGPLASVIGAGYFGALGIPVIKGRGIVESDDAGGEPVLVVNRALAAAYWPGEDPMGKCLIVDKRTDACRRIVGVVGDPHVNAVIEEPTPEFFLPMAQAPRSWSRPGTIVLHTKPGSVHAVAAAATVAVRVAFGGNIVPAVRSMDDLTGEQMSQWRLGAALFSVAGILALLVAAVGIYSTMSYSVGQRTHEIGVRMALGARGGRVARLIVVQGVRVVAIGVGIGLVAALASGRLVASLLYDTSPSNPLVLTLTAATLLVVAVLACAVPAWRAARVDPMETLRAE